MRRAIICLAAAGLTALAVIPSAGAAVQPGIDVSRFNERIDWPAVAADGITFAFVQASRGSGRDCAVKPRRCGRDGLYDANYEAARDAGIRVGPYHRAFAGGIGRRGIRADARAEAHVFIQSVGELHDGDLLPALDVEAPFAGLRPAQLRRWVRTWLRRVKRALGERAIIYTNHSSWSATGDTTRFALAGHPLWVAQWGVSSPLVPAADWAGRSWSVWQWTSDGEVAGIDGRVDRDRLRGGFGPLSVD
jgi:GH25 family lysozyme M1 (1,4-beta-N-acetylmuramidase)